MAQSYQQLVKAYKEESKVILELSQVLGILSNSDTDFSNMLSAWAGTYRTEKRSSNHGSKNKSFTKSYEDKKVLEAHDIMTLQEKEEVIIFIYGRYYRVNVSNARYYMIPELNEISNKCLKINSARKEGKNYEQIESKRFY